MSERTPVVGVIGGTGLDQLSGLQPLEPRVAETPYGPPSGPLQFGRMGEGEVVFLPRHGEDHRLPPHLINYRANLWALYEAGIGRVVAVAAVGGIGADYAPGRICLPDQVIDYTWGRQHTYSDARQPSVQHVDFTFPYSSDLRADLLAAAGASDIALLDGGVYGATQGPRLETAAEIRRLRADGCDMVGMTGMPEAALARELGLAYACIGVVVNWAAGLGAEGIHEEIAASLQTGMRQVEKLLTAFIAERSRS